MWVWAAQGSSLLHLISYNSNCPSPTVCDSAGQSSEGFCPPLAQTEPASHARPNGPFGEVLNPEWRKRRHSKAVGGWHPLTTPWQGCRGSFNQTQGPRCPAFTEVDDRSIFLGIPSLPTTGFLLPTTKEPCSVKSST